MPDEFDFLLSRIPVFKSRHATGLGLAPEALFDELGPYHFIFLDQVSRRSFVNISSSKALSGFESTSWIPARFLPNFESRWPQSPCAVGDGASKRVPPLLRRVPEVPVLAALLLPCTLY